MSPAAIEKAVSVFADSDRDQGAALSALAVIMAHGEQATALLKSSCQESPAGKAQLKYAQILAILGDPTGVPTLISAVDAYGGWDRGVTLTSQRKTGNTFSELDRLVIALGYSRAPAALESLIAKLRQLRPDSELSHYKAISLALRHHPPCYAVARLLVETLKQPGFAGHATVAPAVRQEDHRGTPFAAVAQRLVTTGGDESANRTNLNKAYKELIVAAMLYRCGDRQGMAKATLDQYAKDVHGHFARYAQQTLRGTRTVPQ
jgi:hypothetical protein